MRVVHVCKVTGIAGAEHHLLSLLPALGAAGIDVDIIVLEERSRPVDEFREALRARDVPVHTERIRGDVDPWLVGRLTRRLRALAPDLVHTHLVHADVYGLEAARRAGIRATVSSRHDNNPFRRGRLMRAVTARAMRRTRRVVAISQAVARFVVEVERVDAAAVETIHYGLPVPALGGGEREAARQALGLAGDERIIGVVGRLVAQKGIDVLIDAVPALQARGPDVRLVVVGDGPLAGDLRARAAQRRVADRVTFAGWRPDAANLTHAMDVVVMPSRWEGLGLAGLEAMAAGRPLVASAVDALPELVRDGETGLLVPADDAAALGGAIARLLDDPVLAARLGTAARRRVRDSFSVEAMLHATVGLYTRVLAEVTAKPATTRAG